MSNNVPECRICFDGETEGDPFISPCLCRGTSKYVHISCLDTWRQFNRDGPGFSRCMECNNEYIIKRKYPLEDSKMYICIAQPHLPQRTCSIVSFSFIGVAMLLSAFIWLFDLYRISNYGHSFNIKNSTLHKTLKYDDAAPYVWYFSTAMFIETMIFNIFFVFYSLYKIKQLKVYFNNIKQAYLISFLYDFQYILYYLIFHNNVSQVNIYVFLNLIGFISLLNPLVIHTLLSKHQKIILDINADNEEYLLSFQDNPLLQNANSIEIV